MLQCSGKKGASALIYTGPCVFRGVIFTGDTAQEPTLTVYDGITAAGNEKFFGMVSDEVHTIPFILPKEDGLPCDTGIYAALSAETGDYLILYEYR